MRFRDRRDAGRRLADELRRYELQDPIVLALPRGGVPVGYEISSALGVPLDVFVTRKIGAPGHREFGIGAVAEGGEIVTTDAVRALGLSAEDFARLAERERQELQRRVQRYRGDRPLPALENRDVILVDDGIATGVTAEAALRALRRAGARRLIMAAPACAPETAARLGTIADDLVCVVAPVPFAAVGQWYDRFEQTTDEEVIEVLGRSPMSST